MNSVEDILARYIEDFQSGDAESPIPYLEKVDEKDRQELAAAMDSYLMTAPRREWDAAAYEASQAGRIADRLWRSMDGASGEWPVLLPRLRERQRLTRRSVTERLATWLDAPVDDPRVASYYHEMEQGLLPWRVWAPQTRVMPATSTPPRHRVKLRCRVLRSRSLRISGTRSTGRSLEEPSE